MAGEQITRITELLGQTAEAHHRYETGELGGRRDEQWAAWYAEFALERGLGELVGGDIGQDQLARFLERVTEDHGSEEAELGWAEYAAERIVHEFAPAV